MLSRSCEHAVDALACLFLSTLQDMEREAAIEKGGGIEAVAAASAIPVKDLSLKEGEKIKMNVGGAAGKRRAKKEGAIV